MITINGVDLSFSNMGLFYTDSPWIHPTRIITSYEIIYVTDGEFDIFEEEKVFHLQPHTLLVLEPKLKHGGIKMSNGTIKFYWLHFSCSDFQKLNIDKTYSGQRIINETFIFQEIMTCQQIKNNLLCDIKLAEIIVRLRGVEKIKNTKIVSEIMEYIRINANRTLTVQEICSKFCYSSDHCSKLIKSAVGMSLNYYINHERINHIKDCLLNTNFSIKQIARQCGFEDENSFVKFFKYHANSSPTQYRKTHNGLKLNNH